MKTFTIWLITALCWIVTTRARRGCRTTGAENTAKGTRPVAR